MELPVRAGIEFKMHNVTNITAAEIYLRNPEVVVADILGLSLTDKEQKKKINTILAAHIDKCLLVDLTKLDAKCFQIIPDPKSKLTRRDNSGIIVGKMPREMDLQIGKVYLCAKNCSYRDGHYIVGDGSTHSWIVPLRGYCLAVVGVDVTTPDPRLPEYSVKTVKFLVTSGISGNESFQTQTWTAAYPASSEAMIDHLIEVEGHPSTSMAAANKEFETP